MVILEEFAMGPQADPDSPVLHSGVTAFEATSEKWTEAQLARVVAVAEARMLSLRCDEDTDTDADLCRQIAFTPLPRHL